MDEIDDDLVELPVPNKTVHEHYVDLQEALKYLAEVPSHYAALKVSQAQINYDQALKETRASFHVIDGGSGFHTRTPLTIATDALLEIVSRSLALEEQFGYIDFGDPQYKPFRFLGTVAKQALKDIGG
jgi:hypothetical protein